jgi:hypothetical protein
MTTISETAGAHHLHGGVWHRTTHALGKLWAKVVALPAAPSGATQRNAPPPEYFRFPPY